MTKPSLSRLKELEAKATPTPWEHINHNWDESSVYGYPQHGKHVCLCKQDGDDSDDDDGDDEHQANAHLLAESRNSLPALIRVVEAAREYQATCEAYEKGGDYIDFVREMDGVSAKLRAALAEIEP